MENVVCFVNSDMINYAISIPEGSAEEHSNYQKLRSFRMLAPYVYIVLSLYIYTHIYVLYVKIYILCIHIVYIFVLYIIYT